MSQKIEYLEGCLNSLLTKLRKEKGMLVRHKILAKLKNGMSEELPAGERKKYITKIDLCYKWLEEGIAVIESLKCVSIKNAEFDLAADYELMVKDYLLGRKLEDYKIKNSRFCLIINCIQNVKKHLAMCKKDLFRN